MTTSGKSGSRNRAIYTLAGGAITAIAGIATASASKPIAVVLIVVAAILFIFGAVLWYQVRVDAPPPQPVPAQPVNLDPAELANCLDGEQRDLLELALSGVAGEVANVTGVPLHLVRANLFAKLPGTDRLGMVQNLWFQMTYELEWTIQMEIGKGSSGAAFQTRNMNRAIWKDGWGPDDIDDAEVAKANPELRWILSAPIFGSGDPVPKLVLNVDGLTRTPAKPRLAEALGHMPRYTAGITRALDL